MSLQAKPVHIPAGLPVDEVTRREHVDVGGANLSNVNVRQTSWSSLEKRLGFASATRDRLGGGSRADGRRLFAHGGVPMVIDGTHLDAYVEALQQNVTRSRVPEASYRLMGLPAPTSTSALYDVEHCNGFIAIAAGATFAGTCKVGVVEASTGTVVRSFETLGSGIGLVWVASFGDRYFVAIVYTISSTAVDAFLLDTLAMSSGWVALATLAASTGGALPSVCSLSDRVAVGFGITSGTDRLEVTTLDESGIILTATYPTTSTTPGVVSVDGSMTGTLWIGYSLGSVVRALGVDATSLLVVSSQVNALALSTGTQWIGICEGSTNGSARIAAFDTGTPLLFRMCSLTTTAGATVAGSVIAVRNLAPNSRPFRQGDRYYLAAFTGATGAVFDDNRQALCTVVDWSDNVTYVRPIANIEPGLVASVQQLCKFSSVSATKRIFGTQLAKSGAANFYSITLGNATIGNVAVELDFGARARWQPVDHANVTYLGGAVLSVYDGEVVTESGFIGRPTKPTTSVAGTGLTGDYRYVAIYEDVDAEGTWVVSGISEPSDVVSPANQTVTVTTSPLSISARVAKGTTRVAFYRTADGGKPPYYRVAAVSNDTSGSTVSYADAVADAQLTTHAKLYAPSLPGAPSGSLERLAPNGLPLIVSYNGMLVGARGEEIFYSGQEVYGEAVWHSPDFRVPLSGGGDVTALAAQDGTLYVFKADRIFALVGEAPSDNGLQGGFGTPRLLASDVGCLEPDSVVTTSLGIFFQSSRGIELLTRSQTVEPVGKPIQTTLAAHPVVASAVLDARNGLVRWTLTTSENAGAVSGESARPVFDLVQQKWIGTDQMTGASANQAAQSAATVFLNGAWRYAWLTSDGRLYYERDADDESAHLDGSTWVTAQYRTPYLKLGLQQEMRLFDVEFLFEHHTDAGLTIEAANDYSESFATTKTWDVDALDGQRQVDFRPRPNADSTSFRITDSAPDGEGGPGTGKGLTFIGLSADVAPRQGPTRGTPRLATELRR